MKTTRGPVRHRQRAEAPEMSLTTTTDTNNISGNIVKLKIH